MIGNASNPMLAQAEQGIQAKVPANLQSALAKVIHAGVTIMYSPKIAQQRNEQLATMKDPVGSVGPGAARLMYNLYQQSKKTIPIPLIIPAAMIISMEYLDLLAKAGKVQITPDVIAKSVQSVVQATLPLLGLTPQKMAQLQQMSAQKSGGAAPAPAAPGILGSAQGGM